MEWNDGIDRNGGMGWLAGSGLFLSFDCMHMILPCCHQPVLSLMFNSGIRLPQFSVLIWQVRLRRTSITCTKPILQASCNGICNLGSAFALSNC